mgnify:CR=1 FL=1
MNTDKIFCGSHRQRICPQGHLQGRCSEKTGLEGKALGDSLCLWIWHRMALVLGLGMCLSMQVIGGGGVLMTGAGILLGILGIVGVGLNYPIYKKLLRSGKEKYAFEIMQLAREISESAE